MGERPGGEAKESARSSGFLRMPLKGFRWESHTCRSVGSKDQPEEKRKLSLAIIL